MDEYEVKFYVDSRGNSPVLDYIEGLSLKEKAKVLRYIEFLRVNKGVLDEPYAKHIRGKIRELRVDFSRNRHRIFYFTFVNKRIILLHAFLKKTTKTPENEIARAERNLHDVVNNNSEYE